ncbi:MAG: hypothetical protein WCF68_01860 [Terriglobales bacterium]
MNFVHSEAMRLNEQLHAAWKFCLSLRKRNWELDDYPITVREQAIDPDSVGSRLKQHRYAARIVNWWALLGMGDTEQEARQVLEEHFASIKVERDKTGEALPRPGTKVPIQFASQKRVEVYPELAEDFIHRVLNLDWAWISDESSLWDFHHNETNEELIAKINEVYGVDVSDIQSAKLAEVFERIAAIHKSA